MDIVRPKTDKKVNTKVIITLACALVSGLMATVYVNTSSASYLTERDRLLVDTVQRGELNISVRGTGVLVPKDIRWITSDIAGRIDRVFKKAGAVVKQGEVIMKLSNPQLEQELAEAKWELQALEAETKANQTSLESDLLDQEIAVVSQKLNHERALLTLEAQKTLIDQGIIAISKLDFEAVKIDVAQFKQLWELEEKRLVKRRDNLNAQLSANHARLASMRKRVERIQQQVDALHVKASMDSIVQEMPMEPGQQVTSGINLAKLAQTHDYIAELLIPEKQIKDVVVGQKVVLDTRSSSIDGRVQRIDPLVVDSVVQVDVEILSELPKEARPELTVDGVIEVASIPDTLFVKRPMYADSFSDFVVYRLDEDGNHARRQTVVLGQMSAQYVQILEGLNQGQSIIVSDPSAWQQHQHIRIN